MREIRSAALGETLYEEVLPNGLKILTAVKPGFQKSHAIFAVRYGGIDRRFRSAGEWTDTPPGTAHYLEHKMFDMPDGVNVLSELSARGASPNAFTGNAMTAYHFTCTDGFYDNLRTLLTYVSTPYFTAESVRKEQGIIAQEIRMGENDPGRTGYFELMKTLYERHPIRDNVIGTAESIARITPEILYGCHRAFYIPSNMALCCVGDVDPEKVAEAARSILPQEAGEAPERSYGEPESVYPAKTYTERTMAVAAPLFYMGAKISPAPEGRERLRQQLLGELALEYLAGDSSGLYTELYARGLLGRNFGTGIDSTADTVTLLIAGESRDPGAVTEALHERVERIAARGPDAAAFERCRRARYGAELAGLDYFSSYAGALLRGAFGGWSALDVFPLLQEIDAGEAAAFLSENVTPERLAVSVIRPGL